MACEDLGAQLYPSVTISPSWVLQAVGRPVTAPSILGSIASDIVAPIFHGGATTVLLFEAMGGDSQKWLVSNASSQP